MLLVRLPIFYTSTYWNKCLLKHYDSTLAEGHHINFFTAFISIDQLIISIARLYILLNQSPNFIFSNSIARLFSNSIDRLELGWSSF
jgi:hypothetical protein